MDTSSPTAPAMNGAVYRPGSTAPRRTKPSEKGASVAKKNPGENTEDTVTAMFLKNYHLVKTPLCLPNIGQAYDCWKQEQEQKQMRKKMLPLQRHVFVTSNPGQQPQQPKGTALHDTKKNPRHRRAHVDFVPALAAEAEQKAQQSTVPFTGRLSSGRDSTELSSRFTSQQSELPRRYGTNQSTDTNLPRPTPRPSSGKPEKPDQSSSAVSPPPMDPRGRQNPPLHPRGVPGPEFFRPEIVPPPGFKPVSDCFTTTKPHDAARYHDGSDHHKLVENDGQFGSSNGSNMRNNPSQNHVFAKSRCILPTDYDQDDGDVFTLLDEEHAANTSTNMNATTSSSQGVATTGTSNPDFTYGPTSMSQPVPKELPPTAPSAPVQTPPRTDAAASVREFDSIGPFALNAWPPRDGPQPFLRSAEPPLLDTADTPSLDNTATQCPTVDRGSVRRGSDRRQGAPVATSGRNTSRIQSTLSGVPNIAPTAPSHALRGDEKPSTQISSSDRSNSIINPKAVSPTTGCSQPACGGEEEEASGTGLCLPACAIPFVPEHRRFGPMSPEDTDRLLCSLGTNDLIALCTKCQCELQERGRSFTSLISGRGGNGNNGTAAGEAAAAATGEIATADPDDGISIGGGRASKEKRKFDAAGSDLEQNTRAAHEKTATQTQQSEEQKSKKQKSEDVQAFPTTFSEGNMQSIHHSPAPSVFPNPSAPHLDLQSEAQSQPDEAATAGEGSGDGQPSNQQLEDATSRTESDSTPATATEIAAGEFLPANPAAVDKADDLEWHYVNEDCWKTPQPLCGDVFEMVERGDCS